MNDTIESKKGGLLWNVLNIEKKPVKNRNRTFFTVACSKCGFQVTSEKGNILNRVKCPGCSPKPAALKTDEAGNCISICEIGMVVFIRDHQDKHGVSERAAVRHFIETAKTHVVTDDPILEGMTEDSVNAKVRRLTGKKKDAQQDCGDPPQNIIKKENKEKSQKAHWNAVERKLSSVVDYMMENCRNKEGNLTKETALKILDRIRHLTVIRDHFLEGVKNANS